MTRVKAALQIWTDPVTMDTGSPDPTTIMDGSTLWVAYRARDPEFPGWGHPATDEYLERHEGVEAFGVLSFEGVAQQHLGPPNEDGLREHPLWGKGLEYYQFHRLEGDQGSTRWIVTFHDETLDVVAGTAMASALVFAANAIEAIEKVRKGT